MSHIHWVPRQNKLERPRDKDEVNKREIRERDGRANMWTDATFWFSNFMRNASEREKKEKKSCTLKEAPEIPLRCRGIMVAAKFRRRRYGSRGQCSY